MLAGCGGMVKTPDVDYAMRWWNALNGDQMVAALYGDMATPAQDAAARKMYADLDAKTKDEVNLVATEINGDRTFTSVGEWWETLDCRLMRVAAGDGNVADPMSPYCAHYPGSGHMKILGEDALAHVNKVGVALLGRSDPGTYAPVVVAMTYNVYFGSESAAVLTAPQNEVPGVVRGMHDAVIASDFRARAAAIATSIKAADPHVIGFQELSDIRTQSPGDAVIGGQQKAETPVLDLLAILEEALAAEGLDYSVAHKVQNNDVELPMATDVVGVFDDMRLITYDVIMVRSDVTVADRDAANYATTLPTRIGPVKRSYVAVDATIGGVTYRVVNTHLEAYGPPTNLTAVRLGQARELTALLAAETLPVILLGDFNSAAPDGAVYRHLLAEGYVDVWSDEAGQGYTCCQAANLRNAESELHERIDYVLVKNVQSDAVRRAYTVGDKPSDRLRSDLSSDYLWPSDHAGVVVELTGAPSR